MSELKLSGVVRGETMYNGDLRIAQGTIIIGDVFASGKIVVENHCRILGNVVARNEVILGNKNKIEGMVESQLAGVELGDENKAECISGFDVSLGNLNVIHNWISSPGGVKETGTLPSVWGMLFD